MDDAREYERSVYVIQQMVDDISACVPFHLDYDLQVIAKEMGQEQNGELFRCLSFMDARRTSLT